MLYSEYRTIAQTGDLVLFSGKGAISSAIKRFTFSKWSHVGMVVHHSGLDLIALWESTTLSNVRDLSSGEFRRGVQTVPLSLRLASYDGEAAIRRVDVPPDNADLEVLALLRKEYEGRPYEENNLELIRAAYDGPFGRNERDVSSLFCSELVAEVLQAWDVLPPEPPSNEYTPEDFASRNFDGFFQDGLEPLIYQE